MLMLFSLKNPKYVQQKGYNFRKFEHILRLNPKTKFCFRKFNTLNPFKLFIYYRK